MSNFPEGATAQATLKVQKPNGQDAPVGTLTDIPVWTNSNPAALDLFVQPDGMSAVLRWMDEGSGQISVSGQAGGKTVVPATYDFVCDPFQTVKLVLEVTEPAIA